MRFFSADFLGLDPPGLTSLALRVLEFPSPPIEKLLLNTFLGLDFVSPEKEICFFKVLTPSLWEWIF